METAAATPPGAGKGRGRGRGRGRPPKSQATPEKASAAGGSGSAAAAAGGAGGSADAAATSPGPGTGAGAAAGGSAAGGSAAAAGLGPAGGGVTKKRPGRPAKPKVAADEAPAADDLGRLEELPPPPPPPDTSMPYRNMFTKELERLMYGFGDSERPLPQTVQVVEDILIEYVRGTCCAALNEAGRLGKLERDRASGATKLKIDEKDILFLVRKDPKKYTRIRELLEMQIQIKEMRKALDEQALQKIETEDAPGAGGAGAGGDDGGGEDLGPDVPDEDLDVE